MVEMLEASRQYQNNVEVISEQYITTAALWRIGKDLYFNYVNIMNVLNKESFMKKWRRMFPDYRVHGISTPGHGDGAMCPVCPGLIIALDNPDLYKETFPGWEVVLSLIHI